MPHNSVSKKFFHIHLVSDSTGETLNAVAKAATVQFVDFQPIEHSHVLVRNKNQLEIYKLHGRLVPHFLLILNKI